MTITMCCTLRRLPSARADGASTKKSAANAMIVLVRIAHLDPRMRRLPDSVGLCSTVAPAWPRVSDVRVFRTVAGHLQPQRYLARLPWRTARFLKIGGPLPLTD